MTSTTQTAGITSASAANQIRGRVKTAVTAADGVSADRVQNLSLISQARVSRLTRAAASATAEYGASSTQATAAQNTLSAGKTAVGRVQILQRQITTAAPPVTAAGWALHGRVYDAQLQPLSGHTVFLVDSQMIYQPAFGFAYTDSSGYFLINYPGAAPSAAGANPGGPGACATPATPGAAPASGATEQYFVQIANPGAKPVYLSASAFQPSAGKASYQNITLPPGEPELGDPPQAIRQVAMPLQK